MSKPLFGFMSLYLISTLLMCWLNFVSADDQETVVKHRQDVMDDIKEAMKAVKVAVDHGDVKSAAAPAAKIKDLTQDLTKLFPPNSTNSDSGAKLEIWSHWDDFTKIAEGAHTHADALVAAVAGGDSAILQNAVKDMGSSCKSCHKDFRSEK